MSDSVWPHRRQPTRLPCPWDSPGNNTGVGCHFLLQCMKVKSEREVAQLCPILCDPIDHQSVSHSPPVSTVPGVLQARTLEWVAISSSSAWKWKVKVKSLSRAWFLASPWTAAHQAPPSMGFSRQEYWSGVPLPSPRYSLAPALSATTSIWHFSSSRALYRIIKNGKVHFLSVSWTLAFCFRHPLSIGSGTPNIFLSLHVPYLKFFSTNPYFKPVTYHLFYIHLFPY